MSWSRAQDEILRAIAAGGGTFSDVARRLKVSRNAVAGRAHRLGVTFQGRWDYWTAAHDDALRRCATAGMSMRETSAHLHIPIGTLGPKASRLGVRFLGGLDL